MSERRSGHRGLSALGVLLACVSCASEAPEESAWQQRQPVTVESGFNDETFVSGLSNPVAMAFAPDGRLFVAQQGGKLRVVKNGSLLATPFVDLPVVRGGERGLLGIALDPGFASNGYVYVYYTADSPTIHNRVSRFTAAGDVAAAGSELVIVELDDLSANNHNGGALHFGPDGKLYVAVGENSRPDTAQSLGNRLGKLLRLNPDGTLPSDNPFFTSATGQNRAIWALGLRNPFTFAFQPGSGRLFINDVGQATWEEINDGVAGANYGWPLTEGATSDARFRSPLFSYPHGSDGSSGCAITGGSFYDPSVPQFPARYVGKYFFSDYCGNWIRVLDPATGVAQAFATGIPAPVDLQVGPDGLLYYVSMTSGVIGRIRAVAEDGGGLLAQYFDNLDFTNLKLTRVDPTVDFDFGWDRPDPSMGGDTFSVRWTGTLTPSFSEAYTLYTVSDDGIRVTFDGAVLIDNFTDHAPLENRGTTAVLTAGRAYPIRVDYYENTGGAVAKLSWSSASQPKQVVPQASLTPPAPPSGGGLTARYFDNLDFTNLKLTRVDPTVDFDFGWDRPDPSMGGDTFSVRWTGTLTPEFSESYTLYTVSDDGIRVTFDGAVLISNFTDHAPVENRGATAVLTAGRAYPLRIDYYENTGGAVARFSWSSPSQPKQVVPAARLTPEP